MFGIRREPETPIVSIKTQLPPSLSIESTIRCGIYLIHRQLEKSAERASNSRMYFSAPRVEDSWVSDIVSAVWRKIHASSPKVSQEQETLVSFLLSLDNPSLDLSVLQSQFSALSPACQKLLAHWMNPESEEEGIRQLLANPKGLLEYENARGLNMLEYVLQNMQKTAAADPFADPTACGSVMRNTSFHRRIREDCKDADLLDKVITDYINRTPIETVLGQAVHASSFKPLIIEKLFSKNLTLFVVNFDRLQISSEEERYEWAIKCLRHYGHSASHLVISNIEKFGIQTEDKKKALLEECLSYSPIAVCEHLPQFHIEDESSHLQVIQALMNENNKRGITALIENFQFFQLTEENRIRILDQLIQRAPKEVAEHFDHFGITSSEKRLEYAKQFVEIDLKDGEKIVPFIENIQKFAISSSEDRYALARDLAKKNPMSLIKNITLFALSEEMRFDLAKTLASCESKLVCEYFACLGIQNVEQKKEIFEICKQINPSAAVMYLSRFGIDPSCHEEIVLDLANQVGPELFCSLPYLTLPNRDALVEICKRALSVGHELHRSHLESLFTIRQLQDEDWGEILVLCARKNPEETLREVSRSNTLQTDLLERIILACAFTEGEHVLELLDTTIPLPVLEGVDIQKIKTAAVINIMGRWQHSARAEKAFSQTIYPFCQENLSTPKWQGMIEGDEKKVFSEDDLRVLQSGKAQDLNLGGKKKLAMLAFCMKELEGIHLSSLELRTLKEILCYGNTSLATDMLEMFCLELKKEGFHGNYEALITVRSQALHHLRLPMLSIAKWSMECREESQGFIAEIQRELHAKRADFKNGKADFALMQPWLTTMRALDEEKKLPPAVKIRLAALAVRGASSEELQRCLGCIQLLCAVQHLDILIEATETTEPFSSFLSKKLEQSITQDPYLGLQGIANFTDKYLKTLGRMRIANAWMIYGMVIRQLGDPYVRQAYQQTLSSILEGTHAQKRYRVDALETDTGTRAHLQKLTLKLPPAIWAAWQRGYQSEAIACDLQGKGQEFSLVDFLQKKAAFGHLCNASGENLYYLTAFLEHPTQEVYEKLISDIEHPESNPEVYLMRKCLDGSSLSQLAMEKETLVAVQAKLARYELSNDLHALFAKTEGEAKVIAVDTDDWEDLFLCGSEVSASCQRIDGSPLLNHALLGYILDGKNRLLAIKEATSGKILARSICRLLFLGEDPVLFLEDFYYRQESAQLEKLLVELARKRAADLGLKLYRSGDEVTLSSLGTPAPAEYVDAAKGIYKGKFTVQAQSVTT